MATILAKAKSRLVINHPLYATIIMQMKLVLSETLPGGKELWLAATNGTKLYINPVKFEALPLDQAIGVLVHEAEHVLRLHPWRRGSRKPRKWNHAGDYIINESIENHGFTLPDGVLRSSAFSGYSTERVYNELPDDDEDDENEDSGIGDDVLDAEDTTEVGVTEAKAMVQRAVNVAKAMGDKSALLDELLESLRPAQVDYKELLRQFLTELASADYSFARPSRRFASRGLYLPSRKAEGAMRKLGFIIDESGSISSEELEQYAGEVIGAVNECCPSRLVVAYCDSEVAGSVELDYPTVDDIKLERKACGGTDMRVGIQWMLDNHPDVQAVIVLTDGYTPFPEVEEVPTMWAITSDIVAPNGVTVHVEL